MDDVEVKVNEVPDYIAYKTEVSQTATLEKDGYWVLVAKMIQGRSKDGKEWETKDIVSSSRSKDLTTARNDAILTIELYLESVGGNMFEAPLKDENERMN